jgi:hypothetical protein
MSHHYPHLVGKIAPARRANSERVPEVASRLPGITGDQAKDVPAFQRTGSSAPLSASAIQLRPSRSDYEAQLRANWRDVAAVPGGILVVLVTAWLIWAAFAEAAAALG